MTTTTSFDRTVTTKRTVKRSIVWLERPSDATDGWGAIELRQDKRVDKYLVRRIEADFGVGFQLEKLAADLTTVEQYDINLAGRESTCTCRGNSQHGHCKHVSGLIALLNREEF